MDAAVIIKAVAAPLSPSTNPADSPCNGRNSLRSTYARDTQCRWCESTTTADAPDAVDDATDDGEWTRPAAECSAVSDDAANAANDDDDAKHDGRTSDSPGALTAARGEET